MASMNWSKAASRDMVRDRGSESVGGKPKRYYLSRKSKGITNAQAKYLAALCREAGEPWVVGLSCVEASKRIAELRKQLGRA